VVLGHCWKSGSFGIGRWKVVIRGGPMLAALAVASYDGHRRRSMSGRGLGKLGNSAKP